MKKKYRLKKERILILFIIILSILALILYHSLKSKSYILEYKLDSYNIVESYNKKEKIYLFEISTKKNKYSFVSNAKYTSHRKLLKKITEYKDKEYTCIKIKSNTDITAPPLCNKQNKAIDVHLVSTKLKNKLEITEYKDKINEKYKKYNITNLKDSVIIWNYKAFEILQKDNKKRIELFKDDQYNIKLATIIGKYLFIPNYNQEYNFDEAYIINLDKLTVKKWQLDYEISLTDSYILGTNEESIFIVDKKSKIEYELVPSHRKMRIIGTNNQNGIIYKNGKKISISINKLTNKEQTFTYQNIYKYEINNNKLTLSYLDSNNKIIISNQKISSIVNIKEDTIYYLVDDTLYFYNPTYGETKLIQYSEWSFNYDNMIFIYN